MKAITIHQPFASLIMAGAKPYEFRGWLPPDDLIGQRIAIHAARGRPAMDDLGDMLGCIRTDPWYHCLYPDIATPVLRAAMADSSGLPVGAVLGSAVLGRPMTGHTIARRFGLSPDVVVVHWLWAWPLTDIEPLATPVPARGRQRFWEWQP